MDPMKRDEIKHQLKYSFDLFNKEFNPHHLSFWLESIGMFPTEKLKRAFKDHCQTSKFAPKVADILERLHSYPVLTEKDEDQPNTIPCPRRIHDAWTWFIGTYTDGSTMGRMFSERHYTASQEEEFLLLVNQEAKRANMPEAIPGEYKLAEVWG